MRVIYLLTVATAVSAAPIVSRDVKDTKPLDIAAKEQPKAGAVEGPDGEYSFFPAVAGAVVGAVGVGCAFYPDECKSVGQTVKGAATDLYNGASNTVSGWFNSKKK
ncbi:hypothetical protein ABW20_dc0105368 [Dactylellina cionopaga]|nr:hypothetical protein ABW20_dc0105368 [Dactylellina cionopaga]